MITTSHYFWDWFTENQISLKTMMALKSDERSFYLFWLKWHLNFYAPGLDFILIFPKHTSGQAKMIITANGKPEHFDKVEEIIAVAPSLTDWQFIAFVQPKHDYEELEKGLDAPYIFPDITLKTSELKFTPLEYEGSNQIDLIIYLKNFTLYTDHTKLLQCIFIIVQDLLGEKILAENINFVQLAQMPDSDKELIELYDLQLYLDEINKTQRHNSK